MGLTEKTVLIPVYKGKAVRYIVVIQSNDIAGM